MRTGHFQSSNKPVISSIVAKQRNPVPKKAKSPLMIDEKSKSNHNTKTGGTISTRHDCIACPGVAEHLWRLYVTCTLSGEGTHQMAGGWLHCAIDL